MSANADLQYFTSMQIFLTVAILALPILLPVVILICLRFWPMKFRAQRFFMVLAWVFYGLSFVAFGFHAKDAANVVQEFTVAFWGAPSAPSSWCMAGWCLQGLAVLSLMLVVNWSTIRLFTEAKKKREERQAQEAQKDQKA